MQNPIIPFSHCTHRKTETFLILPRVCVPVCCLFFALNVSSVSFLPENCRLFLWVSICTSYNSMSGFHYMYIYIYVYAASFAPSSEFRLKSLHLQFKCRKRAKRSRDEMRRRNEVPDNCQTRNTLKKGHSPKGMEEELGAATPTPTYIDTPSATFCFVFLFFLDCLQFSYHLIKIAKFRTRFHFRFPFLSVPFLCVRV